MLNTFYHSEEDIEKAYSMVPDNVDQDAYASLLIFCDFDRKLADQAYDELVTTGCLSVKDLTALANAHAEVKKADLERIADLWTQDDIGWFL